jgi:hypothetical protein
VAKNHREYHHRKHGLENGPTRAKHGLRISRFDVAPDQKEKKFPISPELTKVDPESSFDRGNLHHAVGADSPPLSIGTMPLFPAFASYRAGQGGKRFLL